MFRFWLIGGAVFVLLTAFGVTYWKGYSSGKSSCEVDILEATVKGIENHEKIEKEVLRLPVNDLKRRYCEWVRDDKELCLKADIPISP